MKVDRRFVSTLTSDLTQNQNTQSIQNNLKVLVTNTSYYSAPVTCFNQYHGYQIEQIAEVISSNNFQFSVIAPRLIQPIKKLFVMANACTGISYFK